MKAIDVHVHPSTREYLVDVWDPEVFAATSRYFKFDLRVRSEDEMADEYRSQQLMAVVLGWDDRTVSGRPAISNDWLAALQRRHPDVFICFGGVDPWRGREAIQEAERAVRELGLRGFKFQQAAQRFFPSDRRFYPLWQTIQALGVPALFHCGTTGLGAGAPGGLGVKLKYVQPIHVDEVAADFPDLQIIAAHPAWPWQDEMIAIAVHKANVWIDLSGWSPRYFPPELVRELNGRLQDKALFGTDYPFLTPERWLRDFEAIDLEPEVRPKILKENAKRLLGIGGPHPPAPRSALVPSPSRGRGRSGPLSP